MVHRRADLATGGLNHVLLYFFDFGHPFYYSHVRFFTRTPRKVTAYGNITRPFTPVIWAFTTVTLFAIASLMLLVYKIYTSRTMIQYKLTMIESSKFNFYLYSFAKFTEPDPLPWFDKWSTGKLVVFLWSLLSWFLIMFYTSNLRSYLVMINYEPAAKTLMDIVNRNQRVYIHDLAIPQRFLKLFI